MKGLGCSLCVSTFLQGYVFCAACTHLVLYGEGWDNARDACSRVVQVCEPRWLIPFLQFL